MATVAGAVTVPLRANTTGFAAAMAAASKSLGGVGEQAKKAQKPLANVGAAMAGLAGAMIGMKAASAGLAIFQKFEKSMVRVGAVTKASAEEMELLDKKTQQVATTTTYTATEVAEGMSFMAMAGMSASQVMGGIQTAAELAMAANMDLAQSTDVLTNIMRGMGVETIDLQQAADVLTATMTQSNTTVQMLGEGMKYVAPLAKSAGLSLEDVSAAMGLLGNAGIQASMAGTTLRQAISKMANPTKEASGLIDQLGLNFTDAKGKMLPFADILGQLERASLTTAEAMEIFGLRAGPGMVALIQAGAGEFTTLKENITDTGETAILAEKQMGTLDGKVNALSASTEELGKTIGKALAPAAKAFVDLGKSAVDAFNEMDPLAHEILAISAAVATLVGLGAALKLAFGMIGGAAALALGPISLLAAGVAGVLAGASKLALMAVTPEESESLGAEGAAKNAMILEDELAQVMIDLPGLDDRDKGRIAALAKEAELLGVAVDPLIREFAAIKNEAVMLGPTIESIPIRVRRTKEELDDMARAAEEAAERQQKMAMEFAKISDETDETNVAFGLLGKEMKGFASVLDMVTAKSKKTREEAEKRAKVDADTQGGILTPSSPSDYKVGTDAEFIIKEESYEEQNAAVDAAMNATDTSGAVAGLNIASAVASGENLGALIGGFFGPLGSAIGGLVDIVGATTSAFPKLTGEILKLVGTVGVFLSPLFEMLVPFLEIVLGSLGTLLLSLTPVIELIGYVVGTVLVGVATIVASVLLGLSAAIMGLIIGFNDLIALIPGSDGFLSDGERRRMIDSQEDATMEAQNLWAVGGPMDQWVNGMTGEYESNAPDFDPSAFDDNQDALDENTEAVNTLTESILNAPSGFKLGGYTFDAAGGSSPQLSSGGSTNIYINEINNPDAVRTMLDDSNRRRSYEGGGAPLPA